MRDLASGDERSLLQRNLETLFPMFSPDGTRIVYFGRSDYAVAIFTIGVDGSDPRQLTSGRELNHQPRWGHDGQSVYFFQHRPTVSFRRVPALGGPSDEFRPWNWETSFMPYFDPTGRFLAYLRQRRPGAPPDISEHTVIHDVRHAGGTRLAGAAHARERMVARRFVAGGDAARARRHDGCDVPRGRRSLSIDRAGNIAEMVAARRPGVLPPSCRDRRLAGTVDHSR